MGEITHCACVESIVQKKSMALDSLVADLLTAHNNKILLHKYHSIRQKNFIARKLPSVIWHLMPKIDFMSKRANDRIFSLFLSPSKANNIFRSFVTVNGCTNLKSHARSMRYHNTVKWNRFYVLCRRRTCCRCEHIHTGH